MSLVDLNHKFKTLDGKIIKEKVALLDENENQIFNEFGAAQFELKGDFTLRKLIEETLFSPSLVKDQRTGQFGQISEQKKKACYILLNKVINNKDGLIDFESEDITLLKELITRKYNSPWTVGQAREALDPTKAPEKDLEKK